MLYTLMHGWSNIVQKLKDLKKTEATRIAGEALNSGKEVLENLLQTIHSKQLVPDNSITNVVWTNTLQFRRASTYSLLKPI
jgi:hypothetical protein